MSAAAAVGTAAILGAIANSLEATRITTWSGTLPLAEAETAGLFGGNQCLYLFVLTRALRQHWQLKGIMLDQPNSLAAVNALDDNARKLTPFFAVLSFREAPQSTFVGTATRSGSSISFFRPVVQKWHQPGFLSPHCPPLRDCRRRDVRVLLRFGFPNGFNVNSGPQQIAQPLDISISQVQRRQIEQLMTSPQNALWFTFHRGITQIGNLHFTLQETSSPGALASPAAQALRGLK